MLRRALLFLALSLCVQAANIRLYLKDGTHHNVREYTKLADRVRYYSTERSEWEEIPTELVDLDRTVNEAKTREAEAKQEAAASDAEEKAERAQRREIENIPMEAGVFTMTDGKVTVLKASEVKIVNNRRRSILKAVSPIPIVAGKSTVEIDGLKAQWSTTGDRPEFYIRLASEERFHIVRVTPAKASRIVQTWNTIPVTKELIEEAQVIETFKQQLAEGLFKIWPTKPIPPGEYAVIEYTEGKGNIQVWDFHLSGI